MIALKDCFPMWDTLPETQRDSLTASAAPRLASKGTLLHHGASDCVGLLAVGSGQLRVFLLSEEGKEVTLYRLFERDICLFSAACIMRIQFEISIEAERDSALWVIPADFYQDLMTRSVEIANYTNQLMASRFSDVMWLIEQILWKRFDARLAAFLLDESALDEGDELRITHEKIAAHLGTAREVVTRMLRYFQSEGMVTLTRGAIRLTDRKKLRALAR